MAARERELSLALQRRYEMSGPLEDLLGRASALMLCDDCNAFIYTGTAMKHLHECRNQNIFWIKRSWAFDSDFHALAKQVLVALGLPETATRKRVEELEGKLSCRCCKPTLDTHMGFIQLVRGGLSPSDNICCSNCRLTGYAFLRRVAMAQGHDQPTAV